MPFFLYIDKLPLSRLFFSSLNKLFMKCCRYLLVGVLQTLFFVAAGQTNATDSLLRIVQENKRDMAEAKALNALASDYVRTDMGKAKECLHRAMDICAGADLPIQLGGAYALMTSICQNIGQPDSAIYYLTLLQKLSEGRPAVRSNYVQAAGLYYKRQSNIKAALPFMLEALEMCAARTKADPSVVNRTALAGQTLNVGNTYIEMGEYREALHYHLDALRLFEAVDNKRGISFCYQMIGAGFLSLKQLKPATEYTRKALELKTKLNDERGIATGLQQMGAIFNDAHQSDSSIIYYKKALSIDEKLGLKQEQLNVSLDMGNLYKEKKDLARATFYFQKGRTLARQSGDSSRAVTFDAALIAVRSTQDFQEAAEKKLMSSLNNSIRESDKGSELLNYQYLAEHYASVGEFPKALAYTRKYYEMSDSLQGLTVQLQLRKMEGQYSVEKKEEEIALLKKDKQLAHLQLEERKTFEYGTILLFLLLLLIIFLVVNRARIVQRTRRTIEMEKMRNHIARDLHDDIGSTITSIHIMSKVALHAPDTQGESVRTSLQKIKERSSAIMERMDDIVWTINPQNDTMEQLLYRMKEFAAEILEPLNINYRFEENGDLASIKLDIRKRKDLYLLFKEAVNNAAKYSECTNLYIRIRQDGDSLQLEIADDGRGFAEEGVRNGNGLKNMRERAISMVAKIRIDSVVGQGTKIGLDLPIG